MKNKILFYSDCRFFAGCENMLANFLNSDELNKEFNVYFSFRYSKDYVKGLEERTNSRVRKFPLNFLDLSNPDLLSSRMPYLIRRIMMIFIRMIFNLPLLIYEILRLSQLIRQIEPDIIHINSGGFPPSLSTKAMIIASKLMKINTKILVVNNSPDNYLHLRRILNLPMDLIINFCVNKIITGSKYNAKKMSELITIDENKVISIPNGIKKRKIIASKREVRKKIGLSSFNGKIFLIVAILVPRKGHKILIDAVKELNEEIEGFNKSSCFIIEGKGISYSAIKKQIKDYGLNKNFKLIKEYKNIFDLINIADVLLLTSTSNEDFPNVIIEGMSLKKLILASNIAGVPEQINDKKSGLLFNVGDKKDLAKKIKMILAGRINLDNIRKNALTRYAQHFSAEKSVRNYINIYKS